MTVGALSGDHAGVVGCPVKVLGRGAERDAFTTDAAGQGTIKCATQDSVHDGCIESGKRVLTS